MKKIIQFSRRIQCLVLTLSLVFSLSAADQQLELAVPFTDNAILQRETSVPVWGWDVPGSKITVLFAGQTKSTIADKNGNWMVKLDPLKASHNERSLEVRNSRGKSILLKGVLVGFNERKRLLRERF